MWESLVHPDDRQLWRAAVGSLVDAQPVALEYRLIGLDGTERIVLDRLRPRREADGTVYYDGATRDVTERRRLEAELRLARGEAESLARTDELTGAFNRRHFAEIVAEALASDPGDCGLLLLDADHFKQVNDVHGHVVGDGVLVELATPTAGGAGTRGLPGAVGRRGVRGAVARRCVGSRSSTAAPSGCGPRSRCGRSTPRA